MSCSPSLDRPAGLLQGYTVRAGHVPLTDSGARSGACCRLRYVGAPHCTTRLENTHGTELREVLYRYHPWFGREVCVHGVVAKCGGAYFRCTVAGGHGERWLEVPVWMFERASCSGDLQLATTPFVSLDALAELSALLEQALKSSTSSSNVPLSSASRSLSKTSVIAS